MVSLVYYILFLMQPNLSFLNHLEHIDTPGLQIFWTKGLTGLDLLALTRAQVCLLNCRSLGFTSTYLSGHAVVAALSF